MKTSDRQGRSNNNTNISQKIREQHIKKDTDSIQCVTKKKEREERKVTGSTSFRRQGV